MANIEKGREPSLNPLVEGSNPSGPTNSINGLAVTLGRWSLGTVTSLGIARFMPIKHRLVPALAGCLPGGHSAQPCRVALTAFGTTET